jgi:metal-responsive CopG/Arc/MetJ family transcriptional regulator
VKPILKRTTITVPEELLAEFDDASWAYGYADRSEAVRQAMRIVIPLWKKGRGR